MKIRLSCPHCGSEDIRADAYASWNVEAQSWELVTTFQSKVCDACGDYFAEATETEVVS